jgi:hypothetical protein
MECPICYTNAPTYVINCGSTVVHKVCDTCEVTMRMKEPATNKGRLLKCPMCRVTEKEPGERSTFSYKYELDHLYRAAPRPRSVAVPRGHTQDWAVVAERVRQLPTNMQHRHIWIYPQLAPYFENYIQVAPQNRAMRPEPPQIQAFCQGGRRETGECQTRSKTKRKCTFIGCDKFVCRSCRQCLTH